MTLGNRIANKMKELDLTESALAIRTGVSQPTIHRILTGEIKNPRFITIEQIAKALRVDIFWLSKGKELKSPHAENINIKLIDDHNIIEIPLVTDENKSSYNILAGIKMNLEALKKLIPCRDYKKLSGASMPDDSMDKTINNGDPLLVDENYKTIENDGIYKVDYKEKEYIRRFQTSPDGDLLMIADNEKYKDFNINQTELRVIGKIVYSWTGKRV